MAEVIIKVFKNRNSIKGFKIIEEAPILSHFTAKLKPVNQKNQQLLRKIKKVLTIIKKPSALTGWLFNYR